MCISGDTDPKAKCSFCSKNEDEVKKLVAGPEVHICNECIVLGVRIVYEDNIEELLHTLGYLAVGSGDLQMIADSGVFNFLNYLRDFILRNNDREDVSEQEFIGDLNATLVKILPTAVRASIEAIEHELYPIQGGATLTETSPVCVQITEHEQAIADLQEKKETCAQLSEKLLALQARQRALL